MRAGMRSLSALLLLLGLGDGLRMKVAKQALKVGSHASEAADLLTLQMEQQFALGDDAAGMKLFETAAGGVVLEASNASCHVRMLAEKNAVRKMQERAAFLHTHSNIRESGAMALKSVNTWNAALLFTPYYPCFWSLEKTTSVSTQWDGGKWLCGLQELSSAKPDACVVYSIGSNFDVSFEQYISEATQAKCEVHIYDPTMGPREKLDKWVAALPPNLHFHELGIAGNGLNATIRPPQEKEAATFPSITIEEAFKQNGHSKIDILKFDIESYEYELLDKVNWEDLKIGIISFELHANMIEKRLSKPYTSDQFDRHLARMEAAGYRLYSMEPVCTRCIGQVEVAMIHRDWDPTCGFECSCD